MADADGPMPWALGDAAVVVRCDRFSYITIEYCTVQEPLRPGCSKPQVQSDVTPVRPHADRPDDRPSP